MTLADYKKVGSRLEVDEVGLVPGAAFHLVIVRVELVPRGVKLFNCLRGGPAGFKVKSPLNDKRE
jgi:hypothetical protein